MLTRNFSHNHPKFNKISLKNPLIYQKNLNNMSYFDFSKSYEKVVRLEKSIVMNLRNRKNVSDKTESLTKVAKNHIIFI